MSVNTIAPTSTQLCTFRAGSLLLGIDVLNVQEVLRNLEITGVPHAAPSVRGLINLRGQIATAIDVADRLGIEPSGIPNVHVVVHNGSDIVSLLVDRIDDVFDVSPDDYEPAPDTLTGAAKELILGAYKLEDELLLVPAVDRMMRVAQPTETS